MGEPSTSELVHSAATGDQQAWSQLVDRYSRLVWAVARAHRLDQVDAADVYQTTWLRLVEHLSRLREPSRLHAWLVTTARHESLRMVQLRGRERPYATQDDGTNPEHADRTQPEPDADLLSNEEHAAVARAFTQLPHRCQTLLRLLVADPPPTYVQIAGILDMPIGGIGPNRRRCLDHLRRLLGEPPTFTD